MITRALPAGVPLALTSAVLFGASVPVSKLLLGALDPWLLAGLLYLGAGLGLAALQAVRLALGRPAAEAPLRRADLPWLALVVLTGGVLGPVLLLAGLARTDAAATALLLNLEGLATIALAWLAFRENVDRRLLLGAAAILAGAALLSWQGHATFGWGSLLIPAACLCWGLDNNLTRRLSAADPVQIAMIKGLAAGSVNAGLAWANGAALPAPSLLLAAGVVGFLGTGVSLALFVHALRFLGAARTGAYFAAAPFVGALLALVILHDTPTIQLWLAGALMGWGVWLHLSEQHAHDHAHDPLAHEHRHRHDAHHQHAHATALPAGEAHSHAHRHTTLVHRHPHYPDLHHRHGHGRHRHGRQGHGRHGLGRAKSQ